MIICRKFRGKIKERKPWISCLYLFSSLKYGNFLVLFLGLQADLPKISFLSESSCLVLFDHFMLLLDWFGALKIFLG